MSGQSAFGLLHDRAGRRRRRRLRSVDDADHVPAGRQSLGHQRPQEIHHRRRRRQGRHRHGEVGRRRLHVPGRPAGSRDPHRARAQHDRQFDAGRPCRDRRSRTFASPPTRCSAPAGEGFKYAQIRLSPARLSHCMRWLGARHPRQRDRHRLCLPPPRVRQTADRSRRRRLHAGGEPDRSEAVPN